jgi:hypothetical protein
MTEYRVIYRDGRTQAISADSFGSNGDYWLFTRNGIESLIAKKDVESVMDADIPEPRMPEVQVSEMTRPSRGHGFS